MTPRLARIRRLSFAEILGKCRGKAVNLLSPRRNLRRVAFALDRASLREHPGIYVERPEYGPSNLEVKLQRKAAGGPFEPRDVTLTNRVAVDLAHKESPASILEVGCGTAMFALSIATKLPRCRIVASEFEDATREWSAANRPAKNITFCKSPLSDFGIDEFELVVSLEVIEHIDDYASFLREISFAAPVTILSTPNRQRGAFESIANPPAFKQHVREWTGGEFFWVLRVFWKDVELYTIPGMHGQIRRLAENEGYNPSYVQTGVNCREHSLIAVCRNPVRA